MRRKRRCFKCEHLMRKITRTPYSIGICKLHHVTIPDSLCGCKKMDAGRYLLFNIPPAPPDDG